MKVEFKVIVYKSYGPFIFKCESHAQAVDTMRRYWFSPGVWNIRLFANNEELDVTDLVKSWGPRPTYC